MQYKIEVAGVNSLLLRFSDQVDQELIAKIGVACEALRKALNPMLIELVPSYTTLLLTYDLLKADDQSIRQSIRTVLDGLTVESNAIPEVNRIELPVCYDLELAPDLEALSQRLNLSISEIIRLHSEREYSVFAIGFSPGFGYLGELDERLQVPRLATPRTVVPRGSVAIAELNTAVYPQETPGGWWLIGQCPLLMFDAERASPCLFKVGDRVKFLPISRAEYEAFGDRS